MKKNFVVFMSPGTFVAEMTQKEIDFWDVSKAVEMSKNIKERYGSIPYGFYFITRERGENDFDSKETKRSSMYYLGGKILTLEELKSRNDPKDKTLISNMECNNWDKVIINDNSWRWTQPLKHDDKVLELS